MTLICEHCFNFVPLHTKFASTESLLSAYLMAGTQIRYVSISHVVFT